LGFSMILFLFILVSMLNWKSRNDNQRAFFLYSQVSTASTAILEVDYQIKNLQAAILAYSRTGHKAGMARIKDLHAKVQKDLALIRPSFADTERQSIIAQMNAVLSTYNEIIDTLFADRKRYDQYTSVMLPQAANEVRTILKSLSKVIEHKNYPAMQSSIERIKEEFLSALVDANSFFANRDYILQRRAKNSLEEAVKILAKFQTYKNIEELQALVKDLGMAINIYSTGFNHSLQVTRGYLFLVNVVIPGEVAEFENLSFKLKALTLKNLKEVSENTERNVEDSQQKASIITTIGIVIGAILAVLISKSIVTPLQTISLTFKQLVNREHVGKIPGLDRNDEIGQLAKAADVFRVMSENRFQSIFDESPIGIALIDSLTGHIHEVNPKFAEITGRPLTEMTEIGWINITHPDDVQGDLDNMALLNAGEITSFAMNKRYIRPDGSNVWINMSIVPVSGGDKSAPRHLCMIEDITERKQTEEKIQASLAEKETLLKEVHHRVKNNMQIISSLLRMQARKFKDSNFAEILIDSQNRIQSMALVYNKLYQSENLSQINMADYIRELIAGLIRSYSAKSLIITPRVKTSNIILGMDIAIPCGLVINELVTNSIKYAFPLSKSGEVAVSIRESGYHYLEILVSDNGLGLPESFNLKADTKSLGLKLVINLVENQLDGKIELDHKNQGTSFKIIIPQTREQA